MGTDHTYATLIVGAGFTGLGAAIRLAQAGVTDNVVPSQSITATSSTIRRPPRTRRS